MGILKSREGRNVGRWEGEEVGRWEGGRGVEGRGGKGLGKRRVGEGRGATCVTYIQTYIQTYRPSDEAGCGGAFPRKKMALVR